MVVRRAPRARPGGFLILVGLGIAALWLAAPLTGFTMGDCASAGCQGEPGAEGPVMWPVTLGVPLATTLIAALAVGTRRTAAAALLLAAALGLLGVSWVSVDAPWLLRDWPATTFFFFYAPGALLIAIGCAWQVVRHRG